MSKKDTVMVPVVDLATGKKSKEEAVSFLSSDFSYSLVAQAVHVLQQRTRIRRSHSKDRSEVRGGGRRPWKQKGTGRARHSSIRSPLWTGGGITFGPRSRREARLHLSRGEKSKALTGALSAHAKAESLQLVELPKDLPIKTKDASALFGDEYSVLLVVAEMNESFVRATQNISGVTVALASRVTVADIASVKQIWIDTAALPILEGRCTKQVNV